jgi:predicted CXXCH cytochrome family protein
VGSVHTPVREGQCVVCHDPHASGHGMLLVEEGTDLCLKCHDEKRAQMQLANVHEPLETGDCTSCHMPHSSPHADQLVGESARLCRVCHDLDSEEILDAHAGIPVEKTRCTGCHDPHASNSRGMLLPFAHQPFEGGECDLCHDVDGPSPLLLVATGGRLCSACHREVPRSADTVVHEPVARGECTSCHAAHASSVEGMLVDEMPAACLSCHAELETRYEESRSAHPWGDKGATCAQCHQVHSAKEEHLLNQGEIRTCLVCHESHRHGHPLGDDRLDPRTGKPITCVTCHDVHGTEFPMQLRGDQTRGLCRECHRAEDGAGGGGHGGG